MKGRFGVPKFLLVLTIMLAFNSHSKASVYVLGLGEDEVIQRITISWTYKFDSLSSSLGSDAYAAEKGRVRTGFHPATGWHPWSKPSILDGKYEELVVVLGFRANRDESFQDADNMGVAAPVFQPATMLMLGAALIGLSRLGRRVICKI